MSLIKQFLQCNLPKVEHVHAEYGATVEKIQIRF